MSTPERITAAQLWFKYRRGGRPTRAERDLLRAAYWNSALPPGASQWVEDDFPEIVGSQ